MVTKPPFLQINSSRKRKQREKHFHFILFNSKMSRMWNEILHLNIKYPCKFCPQQFTQKSNLTKHTESQHKKYQAYVWIYLNQTVSAEFHWDSTSSLGLFPKISISWNLESLHYIITLTSTVEIISLDICWQMSVEVISVPACWKREI